MSLLQADRNCFLKWRVKFDTAVSGRLLALSMVVGALSGLLALALFWGVSVVTAQALSLYHSTGIFFPEMGVTERFSDLARSGMRTDTLFDWVVVPRYWVALLLIPALGGLATGLLVYGFAPEAAGEGTDHFIKAFHRRSALVRLRVLVTKWLTTVLTLGTGGSGGWEGTVTLLGGGIGSSVARWCGATVYERRMLFLAGAAGGIGGILQAPLGGALFAVEVLYCSTAMEFRAFLPCMVASATGFFVFQTGAPEWSVLSCLHTTGGNDAAWQLLSHLPAWLFCGMACLVVGCLYVKMLQWVRHHFFRRLPVPHFIKPAIGGLCVGCVAVVFPQVLGTGQEWLSGAAMGKLSVTLMAMLVLPKIMATVATVASGGSGGLFAPSLFIGGMLGGACGGVWHMVSSSPPPVATFVLVGMGGFLAGVSKVPLTAAVLTCELSGNWSLLMPVLLVGLVHIAFQSLRVSLYEDQVVTPLDSPAHVGNYVTDILEAMTVHDAVPLDPLARSKTVTIAEYDSMRAAMAKSLGCEDALLPMVDSRDELVGLIEQADIRASFASLGSQHLLAGDLVQLKTTRLYPHDTLAAAMRLMNQQRVDAMPVVDPHSPRQLLGMLRRRDILAAHHRILAATRDDDNKPIQEP